MKTSRKFGCVYLLIAALGSSSFANAATTLAVQLTLDGTQTTNTSDWAAGYAFTVTQTIYVTHLGKFDTGGDGIVGTAVGLYNTTTNTLLASVSLVGASAEASGGFSAYYATLSTPITLTLGTTYAILAVNDGPTDVLSWGHTRVMGPEVTLVGGRAISGASLPATYGPTTNLSGDLYTAGTFKYDTVLIPEPKAALLGCIGLLLILRRRR
jgi:hypothetical protein